MATTIPDTELNALPSTQLVKPFPETGLVNILPDDLQKCLTLTFTIFNYLMVIDEQDDLGFDLNESKLPKGLDMGDWTLKQVSANFRFYNEYIESKSSTLRDNDEGRAHTKGVAMYAEKALTTYTSGTSCYRCSLEQFEAHLRFQPQNQLGCLHLDVGVKVQPDD